MAVVPVFPDSSVPPKPVRFQRAFWAWTACACLLLASLFIWSCNTAPEDENTITLNLDSSRVGKFDSVLVEIFNGAAPAAGDTTHPVQSQTIKLQGSTKQITIKLSSKVKPDFSVVVTGYSGDQVAYRNLHTVDGFGTPDSTKPAVLLISRILADSLTLNVGETRSPAIKFEPENPGDKRILLKSLDSSLVAVVGDSLKGVAAGRARVQAMTADGKITVTFTVNVAVVRVTALLADTLQIRVGDSVAPEVRIVPDNATDKDFSEASLDSNLIAVDGKKVIGLKAGQAKLVLASHDGGVKDTLIVRVRVPVSGINAKDQSKEVGDRFPPVLEFLPADATRKGYTLTTSDSTKVAVVGDKDSLEAESIGSAKITVKTNDGGFTAVFTVDVMRKVIHVKAITSDSLRALPGDTLAVQLTFDPANATDQGFTLKSLDTALADVDGNKVIAKAVGRAKIVAATVDGDLRDTIDFTVALANFIQDIKPITSSKCAPCHIPPATFNWTDSAQLVREGPVAMVRLSLPDTAVGHMPVAGATGGPITQRELRVLLGWLGRVSVPLASIAVKDTEVNMGDTLAAPITFNPGNASNQDFTLTTLDTAIVTVVGKRLVAAGVGSTSIDVLLDEGGRHSKFKVTVDLPSFQKNVLPITAFRCTPCHGPDQVFNWQDSSALIGDGSNALDRLTRDANAPGKMPLKGAPNGDLTPTELRILLTWLNSKVVPLKGITVPDDSLVLQTQKEPAIVWNPANATNKSFILVSADTAKVGILGTRMLGKALSSGTTVEVRAIDGGFSKLISVKVLPIKVDSIAVHDTACAVGDSVYLTPLFFPANATNQAFTVVSKIVTPKVKIDSGFKLTGMVLGKDTLEASSTDGGKKARFVFTVGPVIPKSLSIPDTNDTVASGMVPGTLVSPRLIWNPATTTDKSFTLAITAGDTTNVAAVRGTQLLPKTSVGQVTVVATSVADPTVKATFKFSVGPVGVISFTVSPVTTNIGILVTPAITWTPANATNKSIALSLAVGDTGLVLNGAATALTTKHLGLHSVTVKSLDSNKTVPWSVNVIRTSFTANLLGITTARCSGCHNASTNPLTQPNWMDSATVVSFGAAIKDRISRSSLAAGYMPLGSTMGADTIAIITNWLNQN